MTQQLSPEREVTATAARADRAFGKKTLVKILISILLLLMASEAVARVLVVAFKPPEGPSQFFDRKFHLAQQPPLDNRPSLLFIGTSIGSFGIYTDLIQKRLSKQGYDLDVRNLCSLWTRVPERMFLLKTAIKCGAKPLVVVCDVDPVEYSTVFQKRYMPEQELRLTNSPTAIAYGDQPQSWKSGLKRLLIDRSYLFTFRSFLQTFVRFLPSMIVHPERRWDRVSFISDRANFGLDDVVIAMSKTGWCPNSQVGDEQRFSHQKTVSYWSEHTGPASIDWFSLQPQRQLIDYCASQHIPLVFLAHPMYPLDRSQQAEFASKHLVTLEQVNQQLKTAITKMPNVYFVDFQNSDHDSSHFVDSAHENPAGAVLLSERLSQVLLSQPYSGLLEKGRAR